MISKKVKNFIAVSTLCTGLVAAPAQSAVIELALLLDSSGSIGANDFVLQTTAYDNVFSSGSFYDTFVNAGDTLWVSAYTFASSTVLQINWTAITDNASATAFGDQFAGINQSGGGTNTAGAVNTAVASIMGNAITSDRQVIDVSTDGVPNNASAANTAAAAALAAGITVNAIGIGSGVSASQLDTFTTAGGGFFSLATDFAAFESALADKLKREIGTVPEPSSLAIIGIGLLGLGLARKKKTT